MTLHYKQLNLFIILLKGQSYPSLINKGKGFRGLYYWTLGRKYNKTC